MAYQLAHLDVNLDPQRLRDRIEKLLGPDRQRFGRLWAYYRNPMRVCAVSSSDHGGDRPYRQAQEWGLPTRITGSCDGGDEEARKEVVIENDIGWRVETMADYLFGKPLVIESAAPDPDRRALTGELLREILAGSGGILFLQQLALLGSVYGFVDVLVKLNIAEISQPACGTRDLGAPPVDNQADKDSALPAGPAPHEEPDDSSQAGGLPRSCVAHVDDVVSSSSAASAGWSFTSTSTKPWMLPISASCWRNRIPPLCARMRRSSSLISARRGGSGAPLVTTSGLPKRKSTIVSTRQPMSFSMTTSLRATPSIG